MKVERPWGWYDVIDTGSTYKVKSIQVETGKSLSLQRHMHRSEHWVVVEGTALVEVGDNISEGTVLCVIEAMKLFNDIESEVSGKIVKILVDDTSPVEFDQPLFLVDPS